MAEITAEQAKKLIASLEMAAIKAERDKSYEPLGHYARHGEYAGMIRAYRDASNRIMEALTNAEL